MMQQSLVDLGGKLTWALALIGTLLLEVDSKRDEPWVFEFQLRLWTEAPEWIMAQISGPYFLWRWAYRADDPSRQPIPPNPKGRGWRCSGHEMTGQLIAVIYICSVLS